MGRIGEEGICYRHLGHKFIEDVTDVWRAMQLSEDHAFTRTPRTLSRAGSRQPERALRLGLKKFYSPADECQHNS